MVKRNATVPWVQAWGCGVLPKHLVWTLDKQHLQVSEGRAALRLMEHRERAYMKGDRMSARWCRERKRER